MASWLNCPVFEERVMTVDPPDWLGEVSYPRLVLDTESSGFSKNYNHLLMIGQLMVAAASDKITPEHAVDVYIRRAYDPGSWGAVYLRDAFRKLAIERGFWSQAMVAQIDANAGSCLGCSLVPLDVQLMTTGSKQQRVFATAYDITGITPAKVMTHGKDPVEVFTALRDLLRLCFEQRVTIVGHNIVGFDLPFIEAECVRMNITPAPINWDCVVDTGYLLKAAGTQQRPYPGESRHAFYKRMIGIRAKGVTWSLGESVKAFGIGIPDSRQHHSAGYDCYLTYRLAQAYLKH